MSATTTIGEFIGNTRSEKEAKKVKLAPSKTRVQFDVSPRSIERLNALKDKTEASSYAEVVKNALKLYDGLIEETERGSEFLFRDKYGNVAPFKLFL